MTKLRTHLTVMAVCFALGAALAFPGATPGATPEVTPEAAPGATPEVAGAAAGESAESAGQDQDNNRPPTTRDNIERFKELLASGQKLIQENRSRESLPYLNQAIALNNRSLEVWFWKGLALDDLGRTREAVQHYVWSLKLASVANMDCAELRINLGNSLSKLDYLKEATFDYQRAIAIDPQNGLAYLHLAAAHLRAGRYQDALDQLRKGDALGFDRSRSAYLKSLAFLGLGQTEDARKELAPLTTAGARDIHPDLAGLAGSLLQSLTRQ